MGNIEWYSYVSASFFSKNDFTTSVDCICVNTIFFKWEIYCLLVFLILFIYALCNEKFLILISSTSKL